jgi:hypothetical protein
MANKTMYQVIMSVAAFNVADGEHEIKLCYEQLDTNEAGKVTKFLERNGYIMTAYDEEKKLAAFTLDDWRLS